MLGHCLHVAGHDHGMELYPEAPHPQFIFITTQQYNSMSLSTTPKKMFS